MSNPNEDRMLLVEIERMIEDQRRQPATAAQELTGQGVLGLIKVLGALRSVLDMNQIITIGSALYQGISELNAITEPADTSTGMSKRLAVLDRMLAALAAATVTTIDDKFAAVIHSAVSGDQLAGLLLAIYAKVAKNGQPNESVPNAPASGGGFGFNNS